METLREAPRASSFTPLLEHQSATPASFYTGPPVLHYYSDRSKIIVLENEITAVAAFEPFLRNVTTQSEANGTETNGDNTHHAKEKVIEDVDVWVTSE
jgi:nucleotide-sensitive chloride channel 1A